AHSTTKCDSFENDLTRRDDSQDLGQNARDLSRDIAVDEKLNPQTSARLGSNYEEYKKLDEQGLVDKPNGEQAEKQQADKQPQETAIPAENQVSGSLNGEKHSEVADKDAHKEPQNEQEKPAKPHKARQAEHLSQENHHQNQGNHKKTQPTTPKSDTINGVSGSVNKLPTDHLPKGVRRVSVKNLDEEKPIPCGANNPYRYDTVPYWVQEWAGRAETWQKAHEIAYPAKMKPGTDAQTAAEHYIFARAVQSDTNYNVLQRSAFSLGLPASTLAYSGYKLFRHSLPHQGDNPNTREKIMQLSKFGVGGYAVHELLRHTVPKPTTSKTSWQQVSAGLYGWHDGLPFKSIKTKNIQVQLGACIRQKDKK
ncbi:MAG: hypothetical protein IKZ88_07290, partial [Neisseriaceae bacterium]|nr:hypothetical protein [Neisseriaceae bacterium]